MADRKPDEWRAILAAIAPNGKPWILDGTADAMPGLCTRYEINTVGRQAHFIAQIEHESAHFQTTAEYASGKAYEGRKDLGNVHKGDGVKFKGRGLIQLTGRHNYTVASLSLGQDFVADPEMVARFPWAAEVSGWFWRTHEVNRHADRDDVKMVTKVINGGHTGLKDRMACLDKAKKALA
jgi:putative chitinase